MMNCNQTAVHHVFTYRVHAKELGHSLLGDVAYGGGVASAVSRIGGAASER